MHPNNSHGVVIGPVCVVGGVFVVVLFCAVGCSVFLFCGVVGGFIVVLLSEEVGNIAVVATTTKH